MITEHNICWIQIKLQVTRLHNHRQNVLHWRRPGRGWSWSSRCCRRLCSSWTWGSHLAPSVQNTNKREFIEPDSSSGGENTDTLSACGVASPGRCWQASSPQTGPSSRPFAPGGWGGWGGRCWPWGAGGRTAGKHPERTGQTWREQRHKTVILMMNKSLLIESADSLSVTLCHSQCQVLSLLPHDADSALFGQDGRVLVTDLLVEQHVGVPVSPPHVWVRVGYKHRNKNIKYLDF